MEYASAIQRCLVIHGKVVPVTLKPLHLSLVELFSRNFAPELTTLADGTSYIDQVRSGAIQRQTVLSANYFAKAGTAGLPRAAPTETTQPARVLGQSA